jgi:hypothetical protein
VRFCLSRQIAARLRKPRMKRDQSPRRLRRQIDTPSARKPAYMLQLSAPLPAQVRRLDGQRGGGQRDGGVTTTGRLLLT